MKQSSFFSSFNYFSPLFFTSGTINIFVCRITLYVPFILKVNLFLYIHIEDITWPRGDMKFLLEC